MLIMMIVIGIGVRFRAKIRYGLLAPSEEAEVRGEVRGAREGEFGLWSGSFCAFF